MATHDFNPDIHKREWLFDNGVATHRYLTPEKFCAYCKHCSDIIWDFSNGPYLFMCDKDFDYDEDCNGEYFEEDSQ